MAIILPIVYGKVYNRRLIAFYVAVYHKRFGVFPKITYSMPLMVQMKRAFEKYGEVKVAAAILYHFEQNNEKIITERFPLIWVFRNIDEYIQKLQEWKGINTEDDDALYEAIKSRINYLEVDFKL